MAAISTAAAVTLLLLGTCPSEAVPSSLLRSMPCLLVLCEAEDLSCSPNSHPQSSARVAGIKPGDRDLLRETFTVGQISWHKETVGSVSARRAAVAVAARRGIQCNASALEAVMKAIRTWSSCTFCVQARDCLADKLTQPYSSLLRMMLGKCR